MTGWCERPSSQLKGGPGLLAEVLPRGICNSSPDELPSVQGQTVTPLQSPCLEPEERSCWYVQLHQGFETCRHSECTQCFVQNLLCQYRNIGFWTMNIFFRSHQASLARGCAHVLSGIPLGCYPAWATRKKGGKKVVLSFSEWRMQCLGFWLLGFFFNMLLVQLVLVLSSMSCSWQQYSSATEDHPGWVHQQQL